MKFYLQTKAPEGNWVDSVGSNDVEFCIQHAAFLAGRGKSVRVVERTDVTVWELP